MESYSPLQMHPVENFGALCQTDCPELGVEMPRKSVQKDHRCLMYGSLELVWEGDCQEAGHLANGGLELV